MKGQERSTSRLTNAVPLKVTYDKTWEFYLKKKVKENISVN